MMKRFLFITVLLVLFISLSSLAFAAGPPKMFWLEPGIGDPNYLDLKIGANGLEITSFDVTLILTSNVSLEDRGAFNGITSNLENIATRVDIVSNVLTLKVVGMSKDSFVSTVLLTINLGNYEGLISVAFNRAEINGGPSEDGGLDVIDRAIGGEISFTPPLQILFNGDKVTDEHFCLQTNQKLIFTASGGTPPYKWEPSFVSPVTTLHEMIVSEDTITMEIIPNNWIQYGVDHLVFRVVLKHSATPSEVQCTFDLLVTPGDVDLNGKIEAKDAHLVLVSIVDYDEALTLPQRIAAEVSGNGTITTADAVLILQYSVGLIYEFPMPGIGDNIGAPPRQPLTFSQQIKELKGKGIDAETINLLILAKQQEAKGKQPTTWAKIKS